MSKYQMKQLEEAAKLMAESAVQMQEIRKRLFNTVQQLPSILGVKLESEESPEEAVVKNTLLAAWQQAAMNERLLMEAIEALGMGENVKPNQAPNAKLPTHGSMQ